MEKATTRNHQILQIIQLEFSSFRISFADTLLDIRGERATAFGLKVDSFLQKLDIIITDNVFIHVARTHANSLEQKEVFT